MDKNAKIYVAWHRGMAGSANYSGLLSAGYSYLLSCTHSELNLTDTSQTIRLMPVFSVERLLKHVKASGDGRRSFL